MRGWLLLIIIAFSVLLADQSTKYLAVRDLTALFQRASVESVSERVYLFYTEPGVEHLRGPAVDVFPFWRHSYNENLGAAFGLLAGRGSLFRVLFFGGATILAIAFVWVIAYHFASQRLIVYVALGALLGGVLSNFVCRITRGYVIDFIQWHSGLLGGVGLPIFNLADMGITIGALVLFAVMLREVFRNDS